jgi:hypothetical protein
LDLDPLVARRDEMLGPQSTRVVKKEITYGRDKHRAAGIDQCVYRVGYCVVDRGICAWFWPREGGICPAHRVQEGSRPYYITLYYSILGRRFETRRGEFFFNLPNPFGRTMPWSLLSL